MTGSFLAPLLDIAPQEMAAAISNEEEVAAMAVEAADRDAPTLSEQLLIELFSETKGQWFSQLNTNFCCLNKDYYVHLKRSNNYKYRV